MSRLVDADELKHELKWLEEYDPPVYHDVVSTIDEMPTVEVVAKSETTTEVVRCKDCKFFRRYGFRLEYAECIKFDFYDTTEDGYCSWGERREDDSK